MIVPVSEHLRSSIPEAIARLAYLYPELHFVSNDDTIEVTGESFVETAMRQEVSYALYRQHIFAQTLPLRTALIATLNQS